MPAAVKRSACPICYGQIQSLTLYVSHETIICYTGKQLHKTASSGECDLFAYFIYQ